MMNGNQIMGGGAQSVTAAAFASKYRSKREVYNMLTVDCNGFLPKYDAITI
jgi:hypothetical protein